jgi:uncharacterized membrane protein
MASTPEKKKTSMGMEENVESGISYVGSFVTGLIFFFGEKDSKLVRFHAMQSIALAVVAFGGWIVLAILGAIFRAIGLWQVDAYFFGVLSALLWIGYFVISLIVLIKAFSGSKLKLPIIGDFAEKRA